MIDKHPRLPLVDGNRKDRPALSGRRFPLLSPECIAGSVKTDDPSLGIGIGHRRVGLTANQARVRQGPFNDDPPYPRRFRKSPAFQRRNGGKGRPRR